MKNVATLNLLWIFGYASTSSAKTTWLPHDEDHFEVALFCPAVQFSSDNETKN